MLTLYLSAGMKALLLRLQRLGYDLSAACSLPLPSSEALVGRQLGGCHLFLKSRLMTMGWQVSYHSFNRMYPTRWIPSNE